MSDNTVPERSAARAARPPSSSGASSSGSETAMGAPDELRDRLAELSDWRLIGRGGFASVYSARQARLGRTVAVKLLTDRPSATALRSFLRECELLGRLSSHPGIVTVFDAGVTASERPFMVMEHLGQGSLAQRIADGGRVPMYEVVTVGLGVADALDAAHRRGVLHLDVKPANVFLSDDGAPVLGDFGVARLEAAGMSSTGGVSFSPFYAAPEVLDGQGPSRATDVYGLGATLLTMIAGRPPFWDDEDNQPAAVIARTLRAPLPDLAARGAPVNLVRLIESMLTRDPRQRPSIDEVLERLSALDGHRPPSRDEVVHASADVDPSSPRRGDSPQMSPSRSTSLSPGTRVTGGRRRSLARRLALVFVAIAAAAGVAAWFVTRSDHRRPTLASGASTTISIPATVPNVLDTFPSLPGVRWQAPTDASVRDGFLARAKGDVADAQLAELVRNGARRATVLRITFAATSAVVDEASFVAQVVTPFSPSPSVTTANGVTVYRTTSPDGTTVALFRSRNGVAWLVYGLDANEVAADATALAQAVSG